MKTHEAAALLAVAAGLDNRKPDASTAESWAIALKNIRIEDGREAVYAHYRESTDWLMPAHIIRLVRAARTERLKLAGDVQPPASIEAIDDPDEFDRAYRAWLRNVRDLIASGQMPDAEPREIVAHPPEEVRSYIEGLNKEIDTAEEAS